MSAAPGQFIVVCIQYRLAGFGFLGGAEVQETGTLNAGLLDQRFAMRWVQRHIAAFGGDPDKVTIDGGSAGGGSVSYQLVWNGGEDQLPYRAAIAEYPWWPTVLNSSQLEKQYRQVLSAANCSDITCLRRLSSEDFDNTQQQVLSTSNSYPYGLSYFGPTVDGDYIRDLPTKELQAGHFAKVPLITTRDGNEGALFTPQNITTDEAFQTRIRAMLNGGESFFGHLNDYYPSDVTGPFDYNSTQQKANYVMGDWIIQCPTYYLASAFTDALSIINPSSQQVYKFIYALPTFNTATHGAYFNLVFPITGVLANDTSPTAELTRTLQGYYTSFIIDLEPNSGTVSVNSSVVWPQYGPSSQILLINDTIPVQIKDVDASGSCDFYYSHPYNVQN
jgi:carboxylesterase type B